MPQPRRIRNPVTRTYVRISGDVVHVRLYAPAYDVDHRGTGSSVEEARSMIQSKLRPPRSIK
jgi:hypothetical protein